MTDQRAGYLVGRADRVLRAKLDEVVKDAGVTIPEITALSVLEVTPGLSNARLARRSLVTPQGMHKVMKSLEAAGLVTREASGGRKLEAFITDAGRDLLDRVEPLLQAAEDDFLSVLSVEERRTFVDLLARVANVPRSRRD